MTIVKRGRIVVGNYYQSSKYVENPLEFYKLPFWRDFILDYGADPTGVVDSTTALQSAIDSFAGTYRSLFIPAGNYRITNQILWQAKSNAHIYGENPATTRIFFDSDRTDNAAMFLLVGNAHGQLQRLTLDGMGKRSIGIWQRWDGINGVYSTLNEYADLVFQNMGTGIIGGHPDLGDAETTVQRCKFKAMSAAGIAIRSFNALDWYIRWCEFDDCYEGVTNTHKDIEGRGNFAVQNSIFRRSLNADIAMNNTMNFNISDNYSIGSKKFFLGKTQGAGGGIVINHNTIIETTDQLSIDVKNLGPLTLIDNKIRSKAEFTSGAVINSTANTLAIGNSFTVPQATAISCNKTLLGGAGLENSQVARLSISSVEPQLLAMPKLTVRPMITLSGLSDNATITTTLQNAINQAHTLYNGQKPIVAIQGGRTYFTDPITFPDGSDVQLVGDGYTTRIFWLGNTVAGKMMEHMGADSFRIHNIALHGGNHSFAQVLTLHHSDTDKLLFTQGVVAGGLDRHAFHLNGFSNLNWEMYDAGHGSSKSSTHGSILVTGDGNANNPNGRLNIFFGASSDLPKAYDVKNEGKLTAEGLWYESNKDETLLNLDASSSGSLLVYGARFATHDNTTENAVVLNNFPGKLLINGVNQGGKTVISGSAATKFLAAGNQYEQNNTTYSNTSTGATAARILNTQVVAGNPVEIADNGSVSDAFILEMFARIRTERPQYLQAIKAGKVGCILNRVFIAAAYSGVVVEKKL